MKSPARMASQAGGGKDHGTKKVSAQSGGFDGGVAVFSGLDGYAGIFRGERASSSGGDSVGAPNRTSAGRRGPHSPLRIQDRLDELESLRGSADTRRGGYVYLRERAKPRAPEIRRSSLCRGGSALSRTEFARHRDERARFARGHAARKGRSRSGDGESGGAADEFGIRASGLFSAALEHICGNQGMFRHDAHIPGRKHTNLSPDSGIS